MWTAYAHRAGSYQTRALLVLSYALVLGLSGMIARLSGARLLDLKRGSDQTSWVARTAQDKTLDALRRQF